MIVQQPNLVLSTMMVAAAATVALSSSSLLPMATAVPVAATFAKVMLFEVPKSPSGLFFNEGKSSLLYVLCETKTNGDHYLYAYTTSGEQICFITIPQSVGMSRVDRFYINHNTKKAYIANSQGPIWADSSLDRLGGTVYEVEWNDPYGCDDTTSTITTTTTSSGDRTTSDCTTSVLSWSPTITQTWILSASDVNAVERGDINEYFRNSGIVVVGNSWYGVNGVHPIGGSLSSSYSKSIVKYDMTMSTIVNSWPFDASTIGRDVDIEGMICGSDKCTSSLFIGDKYNFIYELDFDNTKVVREWDLSSIVNVDRVDKGIEALTYASMTGYFYAGIQDTAMVHVVDLSDNDDGDNLSNEIDDEGTGTDTSNNNDDTSSGNEHYSYYSKHDIILLIVVSIIITFTTSFVYSFI